MNNNSNNLCGTCNRHTYTYRGNNASQLKCWSCQKVFHKKIECSSLNQNSARNIIDRNFEWLCISCVSDTFAFSNIENEDLIENFSVEIQGNRPKPTKKTKCNHCTKKVKLNVSFVYCKYCIGFYHMKCCSIKKKDLPLPKDWLCNKCSINSLPFSSVTNDGLLLNLQGITSESAEFVSNLPSFSIQSLLDQLPGQNFNSDDFLSDTIESKYYTPAQFLAQKIPKKSFTIAHLNIASLQRHIDELRTFLTILNHPFDVLCISETRLHANEPLVNIDIEGYNFLHKETTSQCGGVGIFIKTGYEFEILDSLTRSHHNICESIFIEIKNEKKKNLIVGCIYRHHTPVSDFLETYFEKMLEKVSSLKKTCALLGDFNVDLIKYGDNHLCDSFYDLVSSHGFRPLILQPSRVSSNAATLIDNIFINDVQCFSKGGNITSSISDHFLQFSQMDIFQNSINIKKSDKYARNWSLFNKREFEDEISQFNWMDVTSPNRGTSSSFATFYDKLLKLLDEMAPVRKLTKKEQGLKKSPWITYGILKSMRTRDQFLKKFTNEKDPILKASYHKSYKTLRNHIVKLIRISKKEYFANFFEENNNNIKKTWEGIRDLINVTKKSSRNIYKLLNNNETITENEAVADTMNNFFTNIGSSIEDKIPPPKKDFSTYLGNPNPHSLLIHLTTEEEVKEIIQTFSTSKSCGPFSIPSKLLK